MSTSPPLVPPTFIDRRDAGRRLGIALRELQPAAPVVLALPRGGVPVAYEVAVALNAPLDVLIVRKLGAPGHRELAIGAIGEGGVSILNGPLLRRLGVGRDEIDRIEAVERAELIRRATLYRQGRERVELTDRTAIVVDDGVATGATARAGCQIARAHGAATVVLAVPVAPEGWSPWPDADRLVALAQPSDLRAVGTWYRDFSQTTDGEVNALLRLDTGAP